MIEGNYFDVWVQGLNIMNERCKYAYAINEGAHFYEAGDDE